MTASKIDKGDGGCREPTTKWTVELAHGLSKCTSQNAPKIETKVQLRLAIAMTCTKTIAVTQTLTTTTTATAAIFTDAAIYELITHI